MQQEEIAAQREAAFALRIIVAYEDWSPGEISREKGNGNAENRIRYGKETCKKPL